MVSRTPALDTLRDHILKTGSVFLHNVQWTPGVTCWTCAGIPNPGYDECYNCASRAGSPGLADKLGFVTYGWDGGQAGRVMYAYKANGATSYQLVSSLLTYAVVAHWDCIATHAGSHPDGWAHVPSLAGRPGQHPLAHIASRFMGTVPNVPVVANPVHDGARTFNAAHFTVPPTSARHVLLLDDTWTTGGHLQSVSAALKGAGVGRVTGLAIARWLDPSWSTTQTFIEDRGGTFDPALCPYTGAPC
jgi:hypothetical protein